MQAQGLSDYTKMEQINFTCKHIENNLENLKTNDKKEEVKSYLMGFK